MDAGSFDLGAVAFCRRVVQSQEDAFAGRNLSCDQEDQRSSNQIAGATDAAEEAILFCTPRKLSFSEYGLDFS